MSNQASSHIDTLDLDSPPNDPWNAFRQIQRITLELTQSYHYTLGKTSRFFTALADQRFLATRCQSCHRVYAPPRPLCPHCMKPTEWVELSGLGQVKAFSILHFSPGGSPDLRALIPPYVLAYVLLDGADTLFLHLLDAPPADVHTDLRVRVAYHDQAHHPIHLMRFVPAHDTPHNQNGEP